MYTYLCNSLQSKKNTIAIEHKYRTSFEQYNIQRPRSSSVDIITENKGKLSEKLSDDIQYYHETGTVLFIDIVGYTQWCSQQTPMKVMDTLSAYFQNLDELCILHKLIKIETVGDSYVCIATNKVSAKYLSNDNLCDLIKKETYALNACNFAIDSLLTIPILQELFDDNSMNIRVGIHTGELVSGIVKSVASIPRYQFFGDTINVGSRMESTSKPGCIQISEPTYNLIQNEDTNFEIKHNKDVDIKGKGKMTTYFINNPVKHKTRRKSITNIFEDSNILPCE